MADRPKLTLQDDAPAARVLEATPAAPEWRDWSGETRMNSGRWPIELLDELAAASQRTGAAQGHVIVAAVLALLDAGDERLVAAVKRVESALAAGKRNNRRKAHR
jgi:hypothetical protein